MKAGHSLAYGHHCRDSTRLCRKLAFGIDLLVLQGKWAPNPLLGIVQKGRHHCLPAARIWIVDGRLVKEAHSCMGPHGFGDERVLDSNAACLDCSRETR